MNNTKELQDSLQEVSVVMRGLKQKIPSNKKFIKTLLHIFCGVSDFRQPAKIKYPLHVFTHCLKGQIYLISCS